MSGHYIAHDAKGYQVWRLLNGRYRLDVGPHFDRPRAAMAYCDALDAASDISPLRSPGEPSTARPVTSPPGRGQDGRLTERAERPLVRSGVAQ